jgi:hypothetical protein
LPPLDLQIDLRNPSFGGGRPHLNGGPHLSAYDLPWLALDKLTVLTVNTQTWRLQQVSGENLREEDVEAFDDAVPQNKRIRMIWMFF